MQSPFVFVSIIANSVDCGFVPVTLGATPEQFEQGDACHGLLDLLHDLKGDPEADDFFADESIVELHNAIERRAIISIRDDVRSGSFEHEGIAVQWSCQTEAEFEAEQDARPVRDMIDAAWLPVIADCGAPEIAGLACATVVGAACIRLMRTADMLLVALTDVDEAERVAVRRIIARQCCVLMRG